LLFEGNSPFHQASVPECKMVAMEKILARTNSKNVNQHINRLGNTALHFAIREQFETVAEELLKREDVDVNVKNNCNQTALHLASRLIHMTNDLFKVILEKSTDANAQEEDGDTALHLAIMYKSETALKELFKRGEIDFNLNNNKNQTALHLASEWKDMPIDLFGVILEKSTDVNAQDKNGCTALQCAIVKKCEAMIKELVNHKVDVDVNLKNHKNQTALHLASEWKDMPIDLFRVILEKTTDVNAKDKGGLTAFHLAIFNESKTAVEELLRREDVEKFQNYSYFISVLSDDTFQFIGAEYL
jgi:ankyrin repeat protein